jgi:hypothetical protein
MIFDRRFIRRLMPGRTVGSATALPLVLTRTLGRLVKSSMPFALGPQILPLVIEALADPEHFLALQLYDAIQPNPQLIVQFEPEDERILEGEQGRARRVVQAWFANQ